MAESANRLSDYEKSQARYQELLGGSSKFKNLVDQQIKEKTNYNKDLIGQQQRLIEQQLSQPSALRSEFAGGPIRDPLAQEALIQQRQSNIGQQLGSVSSLLGARGQREQDLLRTGLESYQARMAGEQSASENAWRLYQDALAREQAARAAAQQQAYIDSLNTPLPEENILPPEEGGGELDITVDDNSWFKKAVDKSTADLFGGSKLNPWQKASGIIQTIGNPWQQVRNIGTLGGNLAGNWQNKNMSFIDKLLNRRR